MAVNGSTLAVAGIVAVALMAIFYAWIELLRRFEGHHGVFRCGWVWMCLIFNVIGCVVGYAWLRVAWRPTDIGGEVSQVLTAAVSSWGLLRAQPVRGGEGDHLTAQPGKQLASAMSVFLRRAELQVRATDQRWRDARVAGIPLSYEPSSAGDMLGLCERLGAHKLTLKARAELKAEFEAIGRANPSARDMWLKYALVRRFGVSVVERLALEMGLAKARKG